jgi:hypothetical protein
MVGEDHAQKRVTGLAGSLETTVELQRVNLDSVNQTGLVSHFKIEDFFGRSLHLYF